MLLVNLFLLFSAAVLGLNGENINVIVDFSARTEHSEAVNVPLENMWHF